ncbi:hypothetical protein [Streptomyces flavofungini]|uniref:hypothetical protein n=1 Tax=Streptomyces flavofungini TaxID=68200 RepID=UPI0025B1AE31|nr:hypothetical protein [Streptomyces flavofungini]WJV50195.1 hypothetical protein QUY26_34570 [Streptomyces flavofungini]
MTEAECHEVLARAWTGRLAVARRGRPYVELVGLVVRDGAPVALVSEAGPVARALPPVVAPRQLVVLEADDVDTTDDGDGTGGLRRAVRAVTALGRPRWVVATDEVGACRHAAGARGLDVTVDVRFLTLTGPVLTGEHHVLRCGPGGRAPAVDAAPELPAELTPGPTPGPTPGAVEAIGDRNARGASVRGGIASRLRQRSSLRGLV